MAGEEGFDLAKFGAAVEHGGSRDGEEAKARGSARSGRGN